MVFNDVLIATEGSGEYILQGYVNGTWHDISTVTGPLDGNIIIGPDGINIEVDTTLFTIGQTFLFRWIDSFGIVSNVRSLLIPFTIENSYTSNESFGIVNNGGDSWTFTIPFSPPILELTDTVLNQIGFYPADGSPQNGGQSDSGVTETKSYNFSGLGAGTYYMSAEYQNVGGTHIAIAQGLVSVDDAGNVIRSAFFEGFTDISFSGMKLSCTANYTLNGASFLSAPTMISGDENFDNVQLLANSNEITDQVLPAYATDITYIDFTPVLDPSEWPTGIFDNNNTPSCAMTLVTNIPS